MSSGEAVAMSHDVPRHSTIDHETLRELAKRQASPGNAFGRDASNPYYDFLYHVAGELRAERVLELGTCTGGSASYLAAARRECRVITVDIVQHPSVVDRLRSCAPNVACIEGDTLDPAVVERIWAMADGLVRVGSGSFGLVGVGSGSSGLVGVGSDFSGSVGISAGTDPHPPRPRRGTLPRYAVEARAPEPIALFDLIFFDTDHRYELIKAEWELYGPMIRPGGVALFDDIFMNEGMRRFWDEVPEPKIAFKHLHWTGFGAWICPGPE